MSAGVDDFHQKSFLDLPAPAETGRKYRRRSVERTLAKLRVLHEELNQALYTRTEERPSISCPDHAYVLLQPFMGYLDHEELWVLNLNTRNLVMHIVKVYQGSVNSSQVRVAEVFKQAIIDNAPAIILAHNHPSGDPSPSPEDLSLTRVIVQAGQLLDIQVLDHVIITASRCVSMKERGLGFS